MVKEIRRKLSRMIGGMLTIASIFFGLVPRPPRIVSDVLSIVLISLESLTRPWRQLLWLALYLYISAWTTVLVWGVRVLCAPFQLLSAPYREHHAAVQLTQLQAHYEELQVKNRAWETRHKWSQDEHDRARQAVDHALRHESKKVLELEKKYKKAQEELGRINRSMDQSLVYERKKAAEQLEILKSKVAELEMQNSWFSQVLKQKCMTDYHQLPSRETGFGLRGKGLHRTLLLEGGSSKGESKSDNEDTIVSKFDGTEIGFVVVEDNVAGMALSSTLFSATLSAVVGGVAWGAQDPCIPLLIALLIVVAMSIVIVVRFVNMPNRSGFDAIALLSFNWFILGTVSFPAFPHIANFVSRIIGEFVSMQKTSAGDSLYLGGG